MKKAHSSLFNTLRKLVSFLFFAILSVSISLAQPEIEAHELLYLETDKDVYEIGEEIWINVTILDPSTHKVSRTSETLHVLLRSKRNHEDHFYKIFSIKTNPTQAYLAFSDSLLSEGIYDLFVTTENAAKSGFNRYAHKAIKLTKQITPPILASIDFRDSTNVSGILKLKTADDYPIADTRVRFHLFDADESQFYKLRLTTNSEGLAYFSFSNAYKHNLSLTVSSNDTFTPFSKSFSVPFKRAPINITVFPEGGYLLNGQQNRLVFSLRDSSYGVPPIDSAYIIDSHNKFVCSAEEINSGIGNFNFSYDSKETYKLIFRGPDLQLDQYLQTYANYGPHFSVNRDSTKLSIRSAIDHKEHDQIRVLISQRGDTYLDRIFPIEKKITKSEIPINKVKNGVNRIEIQDSSGKQLHQRFIFIPNQNEISITLETGEEYYSAKDTIELTIDIAPIDMDSLSNTIKIANLSITVFESLYGDSLRYDNIVDHCLWNSEFESLFNYKVSHLSGEMINNILITENELVYKWNNVYREKVKTSISDHVDVKINADQLNDKLFKKKSTIPIVLSGAFGFKIDSIAKDAAYTISPELMKINEGKPIKIFTVDDKELVLEYLSGAQEISSFQVDNQINLREKITQRRNWNLLPLISSNITMLDEVSVVSRRDKRGAYGIHYNGLFMAGSDDYVCYNEILNCTNHPDRSVKPVEGKEYFLNTGDKVKYIANEFARKKERNIQKFFYEILPNISKVNRPSDDSFDLRKTIYWNPSVITNHEGKATIKVLASDVRSIFTVRINATDGKGNFGAYETSIKVLDY